MRRPFAAAAAALAVLIAVAGKPAQASQHLKAASITQDQAIDMVVKLPEVKAWSARLSRVTHGKVRATFMVEPDEPEPIEGRRYWAVGCFENQPDHFVRWETFLVRLDGKVILVEDTDGEPISLKRWRKDRVH
jgi:hypothetical protein